MSIRSDLADALKPYLPDDWRVIDYTDEPDVLDRVLVMIDLKTIRPGTTFGALSADVTVFVLIPTRDDAKRTEDAVTDALMPVLSALFANRTAQQGEARRSTFEGKFPAWSIDLTFPIIDHDFEPEEA